MSDQAIREPSRGKAHRQLGRWGVTVCRDTAAGYRFFETLTETVDLDTVDPADRCKRCWPADVSAA